MFSDISDDNIRHIFLTNGFTIKEGQDDLKPYVFKSARDLLDFASKKNAPTADQRRRQACLEMAAKHPVVLEIMSNCAHEIDAESDSMIEGWDSTPWLELAKQLEKEATEIRNDDPEIWEILVSPPVDYPDDSEAGLINIAVLSQGSTELFIKADPVVKALEGAVDPENDIDPYTLKFRKMHKDDFEKVKDFDGF